MLKLKISTVAVFLVLSFIAISNSNSFSSAAKGDILVEIANYKTWSKINEEPIKVNLQMLRKNSDEKAFVIDGQEVTSFDLGGFG